MAADFMVMSFACFFIGKFVANFLIRYVPAYTPVLQRVQQ